MIRIFLALVGLIEIAALLNKGGGSLVAHLALTGITAVMVLGFAAAMMRKKITVKWSVPLVCYALFLLFFLASFFTSLTPQFGLNELLLFVNTGLLLVIFSSVETTPTDMRFFSGFLITLATLEVFFGAFIYTKTSFPRFAASFIDLGQPYTSSVNAFANWMLLIIPLAAAEFLKKHERKTTTLLTGLVLALILSGFLLSFSRGAWLSLTVVGVIAMIWHGVHAVRAERKFSISFAARIVAVIALTIVIVQGLQSARSVQYKTTSFLDKVFMRADEGGASASERAEFWEGAASLIKDRPLLGGGVGSFKYLFPKYQRTFEINGDHPHNIFLKIGVENGVIAMLLFAAFLVSTAVLLMRFLKRNPQHMALPFLLGALGALGHNLIDYNFIVSNFTLVMVFIALGLGAVVKNAAPLRQSIIIWSMIFISLALLALGAHEAYYNVYFKRGRDALDARRITDAVTFLEHSRSMFFQRDLSMYLAAAYEKQFYLTKNQNWRNKEIAFIQAGIRHSVDAALFDRLGELYAEKKDYGSADELFKKSLMLDPQNHFRYYLNFLDVRRKENVPVDPARITFIKKLLTDYLGALANNRHLTIITDNPKYASMLYEFLGMKKEQEAFSSLWFQELVKFSMQYGKIDTPSL